MQPKVASNHPFGQPLAAVSPVSGQLTETSTLR